MMNKTSITTRTGDLGTTRLYSGEEVTKDALRIEAVGTVDEVVSALGLARCFCVRPDVREAVLSLQRRMFVVGAELATLPARLRSLPERIDDDAAADFDRVCAGLKAQVTYPQGFILPGDAPGAAHLDMARALSRRLERCAARMRREGELDNPALVRWLNRLSDYLWLLARREEGASRPLRETE
jgi:cob(I)alamin adenosyltransferase